MANKNGYGRTATGAEQYDMVLFFTMPGTATTVDVTTVEGAAVGADLASITHTPGANFVVVTLKDAWPRVLGWSAEVRDTAGGGGGTYATISDITNENTATPLTFQVNTFLANGSVSNDSTQVVCVEMVFRNTIKGTGLA